MKILDKLYHVNTQLKSNEVTFLNDEDEIQKVRVLYIKKYNKYAFIMEHTESEQQYAKRMYDIGLGTKEKQEDFLNKLQKYSRLGKMKTIEEIKEEK